MSDTTDLRIATQVIHGGQRPEPITGAVVPPIFTSATYAQESPGKHKGFEYTRYHNPTRYALERMVAALEGSPVTEEEDPSCGAFAFASGRLAISSRRTPSLNEVFTWSTSASSGSRSERLSEP